ncbi:hypothetical protein [Kribbella swartbergensis]
MDAESEPTDATRSKPLVRGVGTLVRGLGNFFAGFQGSTWDRKADEAIDAYLREVAELRSLSEVHRQRIDSLLRTKRLFLRDQFAVELIANRLTLLLGISAVLVPGVIVGLEVPRSDGDQNPVWLYAFALIGLMLVLSWPAVALEKLTGRERAGMTWAALVLSTYIAIAVWYAATPGRGDEDAILIAAVTAWTCLIIVLLARVYVVSWNQAALTKAWREQRVEAAVVLDLVAVLQILEHTTDRDDTRRPLKSTGDARALLADAAQAVNDHLPRLIDGRPAFSVDAETIAREAAAAILDLRSAVTLPGGRSSDEDLERLKTAVEAWAIGSLADLPRQPPPAAEEALEVARRRSGLRQVARTLALGVVPLGLLAVVTLLPLKLSGAVTEALAPFAVTWLLLSVAALLAPADVKLDTKTLFNR